MTTSAITVASEWASFRAAAIASDASKTQVWEMRKAFYAGAVAAMRVFLDGAAAAGDDPAAVGLVMARIHEEFRVFAAELRPGGVI
jgi:hypothetical protein